MTVPLLYRRFFTGLIMTLILLFGGFSTLQATEEYARQSSQECSVCHLDVNGGGELTAKGKEFAAGLVTSGSKAPAGILSKGVHLLVGYLHILTGIFWFGTILYVHLILKPAYASGGLPRGELRLGIASMIIMGITGAILTAYRIDSFATLLQSRFGLLLIIKIALYLLMVLSALFVVTVIGPRLKGRKKEETPVKTGGDLTPEELSRDDGKEGRPAYFAYDGRIYDATASRLWQGGVHMGRHHAGSDLTDALQLAPHGSDKILALREVGLLLAPTALKTPLHVRVFYVMAYMNLVNVMLIILIIALWRWG